MVRSQAGEKSRRKFLETKRVWKGFKEKKNPSARGRGGGRQKLPVAVTLTLMGDNEGGKLENGQLCTHSRSGGPESADGG